MQYLIFLEDGRFVADAKARGFASEYPNAHLFDSSSECYHVAKMLRLKGHKAHAVSTKAYAEDELHDPEGPHPDARVRQAMGDATGVDNQPS